MAFLSPLEIAEIPDNRWKLLRDIVFQGDEETFRVPRGFDTDLLSAPRIVWSLLPPYGKYTKAAVLHDWLYRVQITSRKDADGIFRRAMRSLGVSWWRRRAIYSAVRLAGALRWRRRAKELQRRSQTPMGALRGAE